MSFGNVGNGCNGDGGGGGGGGDVVDDDRECGAVIRRYCFKKE